jgi:CHAT domain-containing protein/tetratricopeptide (TPR) repeat protein
MQFAPFRHRHRRVPEWAALAFLGMVVPAVRTTPAERPPSQPGFLCSSPATQSKTADEAPSLELGEPVNQTLEKGGADSFCIRLSAGQQATITIRPRGARLKVLLFGPGHALAAEWEAPETVEFVGESTTPLMLTVLSQYEGLPAVKYEMVLSAVKPATDQERNAFEARKASTEAAAANRSGQLERAIEREKEAIRLEEQLNKQGDTILAHLLVKMGTMQLTSGDLDSAAENFGRAREITRLAKGSDEPDRALALGGLGMVAVRRQDFGQAESMLQEALDISRRLYGDDHPLIATCILNIGTLRQRRGDYHGALVEMQKAVAIDEKSAGLDDPVTLKALDSLGDVYIDLQDHQAAKPVLERALALAEKSLGSSNLLVAHLLQNLGIIARHRNDFSQALDYFWRAEKIREYSLGSHHPATATLLVNIGNVYDAQGDYPHALESYKRALGILQDTLGPYHEWALLTLGDMSRAYYQLGDVTHAVECLRQENEGVEQTVSFNLVVGSEHDRLAYIDKYSDVINSVISMNVQGAPQDRSARELAALAILQHKGRVQDALSDNMLSLRRHLHNEDQALLDQLSTTTAALAKVSLGADPRMPIDEHRRQIATLEQQREKVEIEIGKRGRGYIERVHSVTLDAVEAAIPEDAALIEYAVYHPFELTGVDAPEGEGRYIAYALSKNGRVEWKDLGTEREVDDAVRAFRISLQNPESSDVRTLARSLDDRIFRPVRALSPGTRRWIISPDGQLNFVPFEALLDENGHFLLASQSISYVTTGRDLLRMQVTNPSRSAPLLIANPLFGEPSNKAASSARPSPASVPSVGQRRSVTVAKERSDIYFAPLLGSTQEAKQLRILFPNARVLTGPRASKAEIAAANAPEILHIATHGFFLNDIEDSNGPEQAVKVADQRGIAAGVKVSNPLLRSGLALAGANLDSFGKDNGILTALEASNLDLWGTKLVTLSACDTGVGEVKNGEGVYGLRRAFILAGAQTIVTSLWSVSDYATRQLMTDYYSGLKRREGRGEALRKAKLAMLKRKGRAHPFYWASFIQIGNWTSLDGV